jgi:hypothetical protein
MVTWCLEFCLRLAAQTRWLALRRSTVTAVRGLMELRRSVSYGSGWFDAPEKHKGSIKGLLSLTINMPL